MQVGDPILAEDMVAARLTANVNLATGTTALANVTGLVVPVVANAVYVVEMFTQHNVAVGTTEDIKYGFTFPAGATLRLGAHGGTTAGVAATSTTDMSLQVEEVTSGSTTFAFGTSTNSTAAFFHGILVVGSTAGNLQVQAAQNTSGGNVVSIRLNSYIKLTRIA